MIRFSGVDTPELLPCGYLVGENDTINISLKGSHNQKKFYLLSLFVTVSVVINIVPVHVSLISGVNSQSQDSLVFETLIPKPMLQRYLSLLQEHRRIILSGPSGTGKSYLAHRLAEHLALREGKLPNESNIVTFNVDHKSSKVRVDFFLYFRKCRFVSYFVYVSSLEFLEEQGKSTLETKLNNE